LKKLFANGVLYSVIIIAIALLSGCSKDDTNPTSSNPTYDAYSINGTLTFVDTNFISDTTNGAYYVAVFSTWPGPPAAYSKIFPTKSNGKYTANYKVVVTANGGYVVSTAWIKKNPYASLILGVYDVAGKDTSRASLTGSHPLATIADGKGVGNINYNSYIDTTYKLAKF
jgi:hypothetical protein